MTTHLLRLVNILAFTLVSVVTLAFSQSFAEETEIALPGDSAYPERHFGWARRHIVCRQFGDGRRFAHKARDRHGRTMD